MAIEVPSHIPRQALAGFILALADDELMLGHRNSEWTGHAPILEEDIAFSNIAQDELGHSLAWYTLHEQLTGRSPDSMVFERRWQDFTCCRFVTYPKGDFAYTVLRQYLFDAAEQERLRSLEQSTFRPLRDIAAKVQAEEAYHLLHSQGLVERLGDATGESSRRMQEAVDVAFPQALGIFERLSGEETLVAAGVVRESEALRQDWLMKVKAVLERASLKVPLRQEKDSAIPLVAADEGGRSGKHTDDLRQLVEDLQLVYQLAPSAHW